MKTLQSENYTDPILYEEGFFKNEDEEQLFLDELRKRVDVAIAENKVVPKRTVAPNELDLEDTYGQSAVV